MSKIRVLVVDDSAFMRKVIPQILSEDTDIEIVGTARDGNDAFKKVVELKPDVVTLDVEMPNMDGLTTLGYIMSETPTPVIMLSAYTPKGADITLQALEYGAVDFVCKPSGEVSIDIKKVSEELITKIKAASKIDTSKLAFIIPKNIEQQVQEEPKSSKIEKIVIIATSTGGPRALTELVPTLPRNLPVAFLIIQHMSEGFTKSLANRLDKLSLIKIKEAEDGELLVAGCVYLAPGNHHMEIENGPEGIFIKLNQKPVRLGVRPCADLTMFSVAENFDGEIITAVLTGMGKDGTMGTTKLKAKKGVVITQDEKSCVIYGMPKMVVKAGNSDISAPLKDISDIIVEHIKGKVKN